MVTYYLYSNEGNGIIAMDAKLGGGLSTLPTIAVQKVAINHMSRDDSDLDSDISQFPTLNGSRNGHLKNGTHQRNGSAHHHNGYNGLNGHLNDQDENSLNNKSHRLDPLGLKLPLSPTGIYFTNTLFCLYFNCVAKGWLKYIIEPNICINENNFWLKILS